MSWPQSLYDLATGRRFDRIDTALNVLINKVTKMAGEIDALKAAQVQVLQDIADETTELKTISDKLSALAAQPSISPADVQAVADSLNGAHQGIQDAIAAAKAANGA